MKTRLTALLAALLSMLLSQTADAWDGAINGMPGVIEVTDGANYGFRVWLTTGAAMCGNSNGWVYLLSSDSNYNTYVAVILMARAQGTNLTFLSNRDGNGYCHLQHLIG